MIRERLAIFSPGGIGGGAFAQGLPALASLVAGLAARFDVTFYPLFPVAPGFVPDGYSVRAPASDAGGPAARGLRWAGLARRFVADHLRARHDRMLSFWGYPMGAFVVGLARAVRVPAAVLLLGAETADVPAIGYGHLGRPVTRRLVLETCRRADALVAVSAQQLATLATHGFTRANAEIVPIGAEAELFPFAPRTRRAPLKILHVANLTAVKDQPTLLRAFARVRAELGARLQIDARLRIVGDGERRGELERLIRELTIADAVELVGAVPFATMPDHYRWADLALLTSLSEGQNRFLTEAAMSGVLTVSTPVGHIADLGEAAAVVVPPGDPARIAERIVAIAGDPAGWERRVRAARAWAAAHDMAWTVARMTEIVARVGSQ
jgi:glycosyltransferase involved in cell wall biosynthesis